MNFKYLPTFALVVWLLFATSIRAEENPMDDPDLQQLLKQAQEMQKSSGSPDARKKLAEMEAMAKSRQCNRSRRKSRRKKNCRPPSRNSSMRRARSRSPIGCRP